MAPVCSRPLSSRRGSSGNVRGAQLVAALLSFRAQHDAEDRRFRQRRDAAHGFESLSAAFARKLFRHDRCGIAFTGHSREVTLALPAERAMPSQK